MSFLWNCDGSSWGAELTDKQKAMAQMFAAQGAIASVEPQGILALQTPQGSVYRQEPNRTIEYTQNDYPHREVAQLAITERCNLRFTRLFAKASMVTRVTFLSSAAELGQYQIRKRKRPLNLSND